MIKGSRGTSPSANYTNNLTTSPSSGSFGYFKNKPPLSPLNQLNRSGINANSYSKLKTLKDESSYQ